MVAAGHRDPGAARSRLRPGWPMAVAALALVVATAFVATALGPTRVPLHEVLASLTGRSSSGFASDIVLQVRLPRVCAALVCGAALAVAGALVQATFANPLVDVSLVGIAPVACVGAAACAAAFHTANVVVAAGAGLALTLVALSALVRLRAGGLRFTLLGVAFGALCTAVLGVLVSIPAVAGGRSVASWVFGSLALADWPRVVVVAGAAVAGAALLRSDSRALDAACLGEVPARRLGVDVHRARRRWIAAVALLVAPAVAMFGVIGFLGLAVPHALRLAGLRMHRLLLPMSAAAGAWLLVVADTIARSAFKGAEVPVSFLLALIGAPVLMRVTLRGSRG